MGLYDRVFGKKKTVSESSANAEDASVLVDRGNALVENGMYAEAIQCYDKALEINPKDETVWNNRALTLVRLNRFSEAIESYDKALEINPTVEKIWSNKGLVLARMKQTDGKIDLQKIVSSMPESREQEIAKKSMEHMVMGNTMYSMGKYKDAIDSFNESLQIEPGNNIAWNNKGLALAKSGKIDEAIACYDKALQIEPNDHVILNNKGNALYKKGNIKEALKSYEAAFELNPESKTAIKGMEMCLESLKKSRRTKGKE
jgi:tetratricopeptide (TPR) repeat protein